MVRLQSIRPCALALSYLALCLAAAQAPLRAQTSPPSPPAAPAQAQPQSRTDEANSAKALASERGHCFTRDQQRNALADGKAVPLAQVLRNLRRRVPGEVVKARLCQDGERLIYLLTVLPRDGKVRRALVDASNGNVVGER